ncbi:MAG: 50S ribosomal protein L25/general stress protein Ctc [Alphaproteobacteria bacterium]|nr:50S ribosomal protein L25/general stress protein Ctc [Alphaproteobacteria bacterium]
MREIEDLQAEPRTGTGKGPAFRARKQGFIPAVVYGGDGKPESVQVPQRDLERQIEKGAFLTTLYMLDVGGRKTRVIPRQVQIDPVSDRPVHADFMRLPEGASIRLAIPVRFRGQESSPGLKRGGVLNIVRHEVELICPADRIPDYLEGDLSGLEIHGTLHLSAIRLPEGVKPVATRERDITIASIVAPTSVIEEQRAAAEAAAAAAAAPVPEEGEAPAEGAPAAPGAAPAAAAAPGATPAAGAQKAPEKK